MFHPVYSALGIAAVLLVFAGLCVLQVFLSKKAKFPGIILPVLCLILSIAFSVPNIKNTFAISFSSGAFWASLLAFLIMNIPTAVFTGIYVHYLQKLKRQSELEKMTVQDLL